MTKERMARGGDYIAAPPPLLHRSATVGVCQDPYMKAVIPVTMMIGIDLSKIVSKFKWLCSNRSIDFQTRLMMLLVSIGRPAPPFQQPQRCYQSLEFYV